MRFGVKRVTVEEICHTAGISKVTFYKYFKNKDDLIERMITGLMDEGQQRFDQILAGRHSFAEKIGQFIDLKLEYTHRMSMEFYQDYFGYSPNIRNLVTERTRQNSAKFINLLREAQGQGIVRRELDLQFLDTMLNMTIQIADDPRLLAVFPNPSQLIQQWVDLFMYGILGRGPAPDEN